MAGYFKQSITASKICITAAICITVFRFVRFSVNWLFAVRTSRPSVKDGVQIITFV